MNTNCVKKIEMPVLPLRDIVIYPNMITPLFVRRKQSIKCIEKSFSNDKKIMLVTQKDITNNTPNQHALFSMGTMASILQFFKLPDGTIKILVEGLQRGKIHKIYQKNEILTAQVEEIPSYEQDKTETKVLIKISIEQFNEYIQLNNKISKEILNSITNVDNASQLSDIISSYIPLYIYDKQKILEMLDASKRLEYLMIVIASEIELLKLEQNIRNRIKKQIENSQKEYYLNEQIKAIQKEIGEPENNFDESETLPTKIDLSKMPCYVRQKIISEIKKLKMMSSMSAEASVIRNYIDWIIQVPWKKRSKIKKDIHHAKKILDLDHFGLEAVKDRILEYLAVQVRMKKIKGPILCLVGPPGVGKTSLGKSIAKSTGRKYVRMALGGIRDEAEIRGHRRTYIGSMPGKIMQNIIKTGVNNPLFLLDEIDKMSHDLRIDPTSALLEVLDPEQNTIFNDHYLELDYDLSHVMFIATANSTNIPAALLDRMEIIYVSSYTESEKLNIAQSYLKPKQITRHALKNDEIHISEDTMKSIISYYTREAGVRNLEKEIAKICRKVVKNLLIDQSIKNIKIDNRNLKKYLGIKKFHYGKANKKNEVGQITGLAWTEAGGDLLTIETQALPGKGKLIYTGSLGEIMQESIRAALTVVRSQSKKLGITNKFYENCDIHVHIPEGATPKDGPSAGAAICVAIVSCLTKNPVRSDVAMTGEITLNGSVLAIGGLKEKLLAAHRGKIKTVIIPHKNIRYLEEIPKKIISNLIIKPVRTIEEALILSLKNTPYIK